MLSSANKIFKAEPLNISHRKSVKQQSIIVLHWNSYNYKQNKLKEVYFGDLEVLEDRLYCVGQSQANL